MLVQVDLAGEATKHGAREDELTRHFRRGSRRRGPSRIVGLMLLPPAVDDPDAARPYFRALRDVRDRLLARGVDASMLRELSMGMSHDFEVAVEEGRDARPRRDRHFREPNVCLTLPCRCRRLRPIRRSGENDHA